MKFLSTWGLALAAVLSLAACGGDSDSGSRSPLTPTEIRDLAGLTAPIDTGTTQQTRRQDIVSRVDSLVVSTMHTEAVLPDETLTIRQVSECSGAECKLLDPTTGDTETAGLDTAMLGLGDAEAIGSAHGITLITGSWRQMGVDVTALGAWMEDGSFALNRVHAVGEEVESDTLHAVALGDLTAEPLTGSATWLGIMVGTPIAGDDRGDRLVGMAALNYDMAAGALDAGFSGIKNIDRGTAHDVETVIFSDLAVGSDGTFARGQSGTRIQGGFYGPGHAEAAGIFEHSDMIGAFGTKRQ